MVVLLLALAGASLFHFFDWLWQRDVTPEQRWLSLVVSCGFLALPIFHLCMTGFLALRFRLSEVPPAVSASERRTVDVFLTVVDEPLEMVAENLQAALEMRHPHETYLLDDGGNPAFAALAARLGARYIARDGSEEFKAGNVNHALDHSDGELIAIFDADHRPDPSFLDHTVGFFDDPEIGFVQVMVTAGNRDESLFAEAAAQTAYDYYNIAAVGKDRCGAASLMGSNAVLRRTALLGTGLYQPGHAEDLETSLALHGAGWRSAYVREALAPGQSPTDLPAFLKQQLKWAHGVFEAGLGSMTGTFWRLEGLQKLCYLTRFTYYFFGVLLFCNLALVALTLYWPVFDVEGFTIHLLPLSISAFLLRVFPLRRWAHEPAARDGLLLKGASLFASSWPAYLLAAACTATRSPLPFIPTPKVESNRLPIWAWLPQISMVAALLGGVAWRFMSWDQQALPITVAVALVSVGSQWVLFWSLLRSWRRRLRRWLLTESRPLELETEEGVD